MTINFLQLTLCLCSLTIAAAASQSGDYIYEVNFSNTNTVAITGYAGSGGEVAIPSLIEGKLVTIIGDEAFRDNDSLITVTIPDTVDRINEGAFYSCNNLTHASVPDSVSVIENYAFYVCRHLMAITVDANNPMYESIGGVLFDKRSEVSLKHYPGGKAGSYTVPTGVSIIADYAFTACSGLTDITIPEGVFYIGQRTFWHCSSLNSAALPSTVTHIGEGAFWKCQNLDSIMIPSGVTTIRGSTFSDCGSLTNVTISGTISSIGDNAFSDCIILPNITFSNGVTSIGYRTFANCARLTNLEFPDTVTSIGSSAFSGCSGLTTVSFEGAAPSEGSYPAFNGANNAIVYYVPGTTGWESTYGGRPTTPGPPFPEFLHTVTNNAASITFYTGTDSDVLIPSLINGLPVNAIGNSAFRDNASLMGVTIHQGITTIGSEAFSSCVNLTAIAVNTNNPAYIAENGILFNLNKTTLIQYPSGKKGSYSIPDTVTTVAISAFKSSANLTSITIPAGITTIGSSAFEACSNLTNITLPAGITTIEASTFRNCASLKNVEVPADVTSIENYAFAFCTNLMSMHFRGNAPSIGAHVFWGNSTAIIYYASGTSGWDATFSFEKLQTELWWMGSYIISNGNVTITGHDAPPDHLIIPYTVDGMPVPRISDSAFASSTNLTCITIPPNITTIGNQAFSNCTSLSNVYFFGNAPSPGLDLFINNDSATVYYMLGTTGWGTTFGGLPAILWYLQAQDFDVTPDHVEFTINGTSNRTFTIEMSANLQSSEWFPVETNTLSTGSMRFNHSQTSNHPAFFYRLSDLIP